MIHKDVIEILEHGTLMWHVLVRDVGSLSCYSLRWGIVHVMEYNDKRGFDVYVPATTSNLVCTTVAELERWIGEEAPR